MVTLQDIKPRILIIALAENLKGQIEEPEWAKFVKTGMSKERLPDQGWWHIRAGAIMRTVYLKGPIGISKLRTKFGGKKNRGSAPKHFYRASGSHIRKMLQQLESLGYLEQKLDGVHRGRVVTHKGLEFINNVIKSLDKSGSAAKPAKKPKKAKKPKTEKSEKPKKIKKTE